MNEGKKSLIILLVAITVILAVFRFSTFGSNDKQEKQMQEIVRLKIDNISHEMKERLEKEIEGVRDLIRQHIILSDRNEQLAPLNLNKGKAVTDGIGCLMGNIGSCANTINSTSGSTLSTFSTVLPFRLKFNGTIYT
jgi:Flp pilus assembly protein TadB